MPESFAKRPKAKCPKTFWVADKQPRFRNRAVDADTMIIVPHRVGSIESMHAHRLNSRHLCAITRRQGHLGVSLVEILISLSLFTLAVLGLYMSYQGVSKSIAEAMRRDVENAFVNMKMAEVNPFDVGVDKRYDQTTKQLATLADGTTYYWTRDVRGDSTNNAYDTRVINVYLYRKSTDTNAYRHYSKEIALDTMAYNMDSGNYTPSSTRVAYRDKLGQTWINIYNTTTYDFSGANANRAGTDTTQMGGSNPTNDYMTTVSGDNYGDVVGSADGPITGTATPTYKHYVWRSMHQAPTTKLYYRFPATKDYQYTVELGFTETDSVAVGARKMDIKINGTTEGTADPIDEAGQFTTLSKSFDASAVATGTVYAINLEVAQSSGATLPPKLSWVKIKRSQNR